jgi:hypothetical protein
MASTGLTPTACTRSTSWSTPAGRHGSERRHARAAADVIDAGEARASIDDEVVREA